MLSASTHTRSNVKGNPVLLGAVKHLADYAINASDGFVGHVRDVYFDDHSWVVRYLLVETGSWLPCRKVLISPISVTSMNAEDRVLTLPMTREQVKSSPIFDSDKPISRRQERSLLGYYGYPCYWSAAGPCATGSLPAEAGSTITARRADVERVLKMEEAGSDSDVDTHLHSCSTVTGYRIEAADGPMGQVQDLLMDEATWTLRYLVVNTSKWGSDHDALVAVRWIDSVRCMDNLITVALTCQAVKGAPAYDPQRRLDHDDEVVLFKHHGKTSYRDDLNIHSPTLLQPGSGRVGISTRLV